MKFDAIAVDCNAIHSPDLVLRILNSQFRYKIGKLVVNGASKAQVELLRKYHEIDHVVVLPPDGKEPIEIRGN